MGHFSTLQYTRPRPRDLWRAAYIPLVGFCWPLAYITALHCADLLAWAGSPRVACLSQQESEDHDSATFPSVGDRLCFCFLEGADDADLSTPSPRWDGPDTLRRQKSGSCPLPGLYLAPPPHYRYWTPIKPGNAACVRLAPSRGPWQPILCCLCCSIGSSSHPPSCTPGLAGCPALVPGPPSCHGVPPCVPGARLAISALALGLRKTRRCLSGLAFQLLTRPRRLAAPHQLF